MSRSKLIKDNLIILIGGNIGNIFSFLTNFILLALPDKTLANLYVAYNSIVLILGIPALVAMRMFTIYGDTILGKFQLVIKRNKNRAVFILISFLVLVLITGYLVTIFTQNGNIITTFLLILLAFITFIVYCFRGLMQFDENFLVPVISLNIETLGRTILAYVFGVVLGGGIYGVFTGAIIAMGLSLIPCFDLKYFRNSAHEVSEYRLKTAFLNSFILTAGTEFFSNFDIAYSFKALASNLQAQTEYNVLQIFRKIIFYGLYFTAGLFLSLGSKSKFTKKFTFFYTLFVSVGIGSAGAIVCYLIKDIFLHILKSEFIVLDGPDVLYFLIFTALMSAAYILSNWLLSLKKRIYTFIPILASIVQIIVFTTSKHDIHNLILSFSITSGFYFFACVIAGIYELYFTKNDR